MARACLQSGQEILIDTSAKSTDRRLTARVGSHDRKLEKLLASRGVDLVEIDVTNSYVEPLRKFFLAREGRRGRRSSR